MAGFKFSDQVINLNMDHPEITPEIDNRGGGPSARRALLVPRPVATESENVHGVVIAVLDSALEGRGWWFWERGHEGGGEVKVKAPSRGLRPPRQDVRCNMSSPFPPLLINF